MMADVLDHDSRFGILMCREYNPETLMGTPFDIGTVAEIVEYEALPDGKMNVLVIGTQRFRVEDYDETSKSYLQASVVELVDVKNGYVTRKLIAETCDLFHEALRLTHKVRNRVYEPLEIPAEADEISFFIAEHLKGSLVLKQQLLEMTSIKERLVTERDILQKMVKTLAVQSQIEDAFRGMEPDSTR